MSHYLLQKILGTPLQPQTKQRMSCATERTGVHSALPVKRLIGRRSSTMSEQTFIKTSLLMMQLPFSPLVLRISYVLNGSATSPLTSNNHLKRNSRTYI